MCNMYAFQHKTAVEGASAVRLPIVRVFSENYCTSPSVLVDVGVREGGAYVPDMV